jgi:hypothetical protein
MAAALAALVWANVAAASYEDLWGTHLVLDVGVWRLDAALYAASEGLRVVVLEIVAPGG